MFKTLLERHIEEAISEFPGLTKGLNGKTIWLTG